MTRTPPPPVAWLLALLAANPRRADAGDEEPAPDEIVVEAPRAEVTILPGATVTSLDVSAETARALDLGDLLAAVPGVAVRSTGGAGAPQLVQLRGASGGEVRVLVDGMPLPQDASGAVDLSALPLESIERIEVIRGSLPLGFGGEGIAGAIHIVTRRPRGVGALRYSAAVGSFHSAEGSAGFENGRGAWRGVLTLGGGTARNDFSYLDDNGTPYTSDDDDPEAIRANADTHRGEAALRLEREGGAGRWAVTAGGTLREGGVPGPGSWQVSEARLAQRRADLGLRWARAGRLALEAGVEGHADGQRYRDPGGEVGLGQQDDETLAGSGAVLVVVDGEPWPGQHLALAARGEQQALRADNALDDLGPAARRRARLSTTAEARGGTGPLGGGLRLAVDGASAEAEGSVPMSYAAAGDTPATWLASPLVSFAWQAAPWVGLRTSGGRSHRLPTFPELFGTGGTVVGNEALRPERAWSADLGVDLGAMPAGGAALLSLTGYGRVVENLIAYLQNSQYTLRAENFAEVWVAGGEAEGRLDLEAGRLGRAGLGLAWTAMRSWNLGGGDVVRGAELPGLPRQRLFADVTLGGPRLRGGLGIEAQGRAFRDSANLQVMPARALLHPRLEARPLARGPRVVVEVRNALDHRVERAGVTDLATGGEATRAVADFLGYPLPGRAVFLSVEGSVGASAPP